MQSPVGKNIANGKAITFEAEWILPPFTIHESSRMIIP